MTTLTRLEEWVLLLCEDCGRPFHLSARQGRAIRADARSARCKTCRRVSRKVRVTAEEYTFWQERFTVDDCIELAEACWGDVDQWTDDWRKDITFDPVPPR